LSFQEAIEELRRCAGVQFDPELTEHFIEVVTARQAHREATPLSESQAKALRIGLEVEKLTCALEAQDIKSLALMAEHLAATALQYNLPRIAQIAHTLHQHTAENCDLIQIAETTNELLELCRLQQNLFISN
jgi:hypothetical protein